MRVFMLDTGLRYIEVCKKRKLYDIRELQKLKKPRKLYILGPRNTTEFQSLIVCLRNS